MVSAILLVVVLSGSTASSGPQGGRRPVRRGPDAPTARRFGLEGGVNILLLGGVVARGAAVAAYWKPGTRSRGLPYVQSDLQNIVRDVLLARHCRSFPGRSPVWRAGWPTASPGSRSSEVGKLFAGIFLTIIPAIAILKAGT
ncbi:MAG: sodium:proton antiporter [Thalassobaculum sp.]